MFQKVEEQLRTLLKESVEACVKESSPAAFRPNPADLILEIPKEREFGDFSCSIALKLSGFLRKNPKLIAADIVSLLLALDGKNKKNSLIRDAEVKGAGFINIFLKDEVFCDLLVEINNQEGVFGKMPAHRGERLLLEFVSANPTGPLSVAHARQAAVGDTLANILAAVGYDVSREYYLNDEGNQINILGRSILLRYNALGKEAGEFPEDHYQGQYIIDLAKGLFDQPEKRKKIEALKDKQLEGFFIDYGVEEILAIIKKELEDFGVCFDVWYSQKALGESGKIEETLDSLKKKDFIYESEGAVWFKSTAFADDKDRVVKKSDGSYTYLAPDIAYHRDKFARGFQKLVNIWGPDHHGYIPRMRAAIQALGHEADALHVIIVQLATLFRNGQPAPMSTRKGQYVTLREVLTEVGLDASRFFFLLRKTDSHLDFDLELAKKQTSENPVYYIQYAHARISGILAGAGEKELKGKKPDLALLKEDEEKALIRQLFGFSYCLEVCAKQFDPYALTVYLQSLANDFHRFYDRHKVLSSDEALTCARLFLIRAVKNVLSCGLRLSGVSSPEKM